MNPIEELDQIANAIQVQKRTEEAAIVHEIQHKYAQVIRATGLSASDFELNPDLSLRFSSARARQIDPAVEQIDDMARDLAARGRTAQAAKLRTISANIQEENTKIASFDWKSLHPEKWLQTGLMGAATGGIGSTIMHGGHVGPHTLLDAGKLGLWGAGTAALTDIAGGFSPKEKIINNELGKVEKLLMQLGDLIADVDATTSSKAIEMAKVTHETRTALIEGTPEAARTPAVPTNTRQLASPADANAAAPSAPVEPTAPEAPAAPSAPVEPATTVVPQAVNPKVAPLRRPIVNPSVMPALDNKGTVPPKPAGAKTAQNNPLQRTQRFMHQHVVEPFANRFLKDEKKVEKLKELGIEKAKQLGGEVFNEALSPEMLQHGLSEGMSSFGPELLKGIGVNVPIDYAVESAVNFAHDKFTTKKAKLHQVIHHIQKAVNHIISLMPENNILNKFWNSIQSFIAHVWKQMKVIIATPPKALAFVEADKCIRLAILKTVSDMADHAESLGNVKQAQRIHKDFLTLAARLS